MYKSFFSGLTKIPSEAINHSGRSVQQKKHLHDLEVLLEKCFEKPTLGMKAPSPLRKVVASKEDSTRKVVASTPHPASNGREVIANKVVQTKPFTNENSAYRVKQGEVSTAKTFVTHAKEEMKS